MFYVASGNGCIKNLSEVIKDIILDMLYISPMRKILNDFDKFNCESPRIKFNMILINSAFSLSVFLWYALGLIIFPKTKFKCPSDHGVIWQWANLPFNKCAKLTQKELSMLKLVSSEIKYTRNSVISQSYCHVYTM